MSKLRAVRSKLKRSGTVLGGLVWLLASSFPAWAALGGDTVSILADQGQMRGSRKTTAAASYTVHEIQGANGTVVREYQSSQGHVFAVAWHGQWMPDMQQILGSYYSQYAQAMQSQRGVRAGRHPININQPGLILQMGGHPQWFVGKAYVPGNLPQGLRAEDIQ